ncbi:MAG: SOS response-associated peptidase [Deltaproteobacteria bacterium]|nr:SOS response-associated peptidase [Deltaproteobacteria bacterium]
MFEKPSFRSPVRRRRCIVPACGYYEWKTEGKEKTPHFIKARDDSVLFVAGLWERWNAKDGGEAIESFTVVTTEASGPLKSIHDRMPVILSLADCGAWLDPAISDPTDLKPLLRPAPADLLEFYPVSKAVNKPSNDGPDLIKRAG